MLRCPQTPDDPDAPVGRESLMSDNGVNVWQADSPVEGHKYIYNIKFSVSGEGATDQKPTDMSDEKYAEAREAVGAGFVKISVPAHILKLKDQSKSVNKSLMSAEQARSLTGLTADDIPDNYLYTLWTVSTDFKDITQKYYFTLRQHRTTRG